ncbi:uncharacterized protein LOC104883583 [Beta vulgaris subsp. vulgaris]|uniref:uncharacterized protein LOC104883583 n=1 Tax=Beta vulgaris subsp. vulgaris TaxID=3555 RepID=UPI0005401C6B|nr:uncharacterized protein LOC104883583 [Beta vulgaris subsp. vulgaris]
MGDFNALMSTEDRIGLPVREREIAEMKECMDRCRMMEVKACGQFFTWNNKQEDMSRVFCKLDRCLAEDFATIVSNVWQQQVQGTKIFQVVSKLMLLKKEFKILNKTQYGDVSVQDALTYNTMIEARKVLHNHPEDMRLRRQEKEAREAYHVAHRNYTSFLSKKAKVRWLTEGDDNTKHFHQSIKLRRVHNRINTIRKEDGSWANTSDEVLEAFVEYYQSLLGSRNAVKKIEPTIIAKGSVLSTQQQMELTLNFTNEEIKNALFSIPDDKAPGMDGYSSCFFKKSSEYIGQDIIEAVKDFFRSGKILKEINVTAITLIPKIKCPAAVGDFRPIACCSVLYKTITKLICTKLSRVLPEVISPNQGAFNNGKSIISNILLCQDLVKRFGNRRNQVKGLMMKVDLKKAYDSIEWVFVKELLLEAMKFPTHFIQCIMECISTPNSLS